MVFVKNEATRLAYIDNSNLDTSYIRYLFDGVIPMISSYYEKFCSSKNKKGDSDDKKD